MHVLHLFRLLTICIQYALRVAYSPYHVEIETDLIYIEVSMYQYGMY